MPFWRRNHEKVGDRFDGRVVWCADATSGAKRAAFYPCDGPIPNFALPLEWVEEKPDDPNDNRGHWRIIALEDAPNFDELPDPNVSLG